MTCTMVAFDRDPLGSPGRMDVHNVHIHHNVSYTVDHDVFATSLSPSLSPSLAEPNKLHSRDSRRLVADAVYLTCTIANSSQIKPVPFFSPPGIMKSRTSSNKRRSSTGTGNGITKGGTGIAAVMVHHTGFEEFSKT